MQVTLGDEGSKLAPLFLLAAAGNIGDMPRAEAVVGAKAVAEGSGERNRGNAAWAVDCC